MSLGVLNNLSAMYAANNLNNTNSSLSKTLQQMSSGSKINSGADDAAGLSLINGLQANATALAQSQTNAQEGVGLLQVADGALSQVTNLLNRAVTLATEVSNGTLNVAQQSAANQEYQSILSEISNIGSTTTYNQNTVFGSTTSIYTGDSSTSSASLNVLSIGALSSSNIGETNGTMSYSAGQSVFIDLGANAQLGDSINAGSSLTVTYRTGFDASGAAVTATATVKTGGATGYNDDVAGMVSAINHSGLGLTATLSTSDAALNDGSNSMGILITGSVGTGAVSNNSANSVQVVQGATKFFDTTAVGGHTAQTALTADAGANGAGGIATVSYSARNGVDLSNTDLTSQNSAESALTALNNAILDVAAQDGYLGAQINTLNAVSSVISTQQQNIVAAQNAVQATDYASASSAMSKFQILSQTGIAALAQANSTAQLVTKLLQ
jgi:flagellin